MPDIDIAELRRLLGLIQKRLPFESKNGYTVFDSEGTLVCEVCRESDEGDGLPTWDEAECMTDAIAAGMNALPMLLAVAEAAQRDHQ